MDNRKQNREEKDVSKRHQKKQELELLEKEAKVCFTHE
jgi:hypothetical protein